MIGAGAATQTLAHLLNYHSSLGPNLFHFYPPWSYFVWSYLWRHTNPSIFAQAFGVGVMAAIVSFLFFVLALSRSFRVNPFLHGSARWADERDIKAAGLLNNDGVYVGAWRDKRGTIRYLRHNGPEHILCYAPTRSGKGVGLVVPTLLSWTESVFVTDLLVGRYLRITQGCLLWRKRCPKRKCGPKIRARDASRNVEADLELGGDGENQSPWQSKST